MWRSQKEGSTVMSLARVMSADSAMHGRACDHGQGGRTKKGPVWHGLGLWFVTMSLNLAMRAGPAVRGLSIQWEACWREAAGATPAAGTQRRGRWAGLQLQVHYGTAAAAAGAAGGKGRAGSTSRFHPPAGTRRPSRWGPRSCRPAAPAGSPCPGSLHPPAPAGRPGPRPACMGWCCVHGVVGGSTKSELVWGIVRQQQAAPAPGERCSRPLLCGTQSHALHLHVLTHLRAAQDCKQLFPLAHPATH